MFKIEAQFDGIFFLSVVLSGISYANYSVLFLSNSASLRQEDCCELKATPVYIMSIKPEGDA